MPRQLFCTLALLLAAIVTMACAAAGGAQRSSSQVPSTPGPDIAAGEFLLSAGQAFTVRLEHTNGTIRITEFLPGYHPGKGAVAFSFTRSKGMLSLIVMNCTSLDLDYDAYYQSGRGFEKTSIVGAFRGVSMLESWPDQFNVLKINNIRPAAEQFDKPPGPGCDALGQE